jgi:hypothetical protein
MTADTKHETKQNASHTPGPWHFDGESIYSDAAEVIVSRPQYVGGANHNERTANARLIAAAPELLEALEALLDPSLSSDNPVELEAVFAKARAAVSEAKGLAA